MQKKPGLFDPQTQEFRAEPDQRRHILRTRLHRGLVRFRLVKVENVGNQRQKVLAALADDPGIVPVAVVGQGPELLAMDRAGKTDHRIERGAQLVTEIRQLVAAPVGKIDLLATFLADGLLAHQPVFDIARDAAKTRGRAAEGHFERQPPALPAAQAEFKPRMARAAGRGNFAHRAKQLALIFWRNDIHETSAHQRFRCLAEQVPGTFRKFEKAPVGAVYGHNVIPHSLPDCLVRPERF